MNPAPKAAPAIDEHSLEHLLTTMEQMLANCERMVASLAQASVFLANERSSQRVSNSNSD